MQMLNSGWIPYALFEVLSDSSHSYSHMTSGSRPVRIQCIRNSQLSWTEPGVDSYTCRSQALVILGVPEVGKPRRQAMSGGHFFIILHPLTHACGPKVDSSLSILMSFKIMNSSFMGTLISKSTYRQVSVSPLGSQGVSACDLHISPFLLKPLFSGVRTLRHVPEAS